MKNLIKNNKGKFIMLSLGLIFLPIRIKEDLAQNIDNYEIFLNCIIGLIGNLFVGTLLDIVLNKEKKEND